MWRKQRHGEKGDEGNIGEVEESATRGRAEGREAKVRGILEWRNEDRKSGQITGQREKRRGRVGKREGYVGGI